MTKYENRLEHFNTQFGHYGIRYRFIRWWTWTTTWRTTDSSYANTSYYRSISKFPTKHQRRKNQMAVLQICRTVREKIFPFMKFTNEYVLRHMKICEPNNMVHMLLQDLNCLDNSDISRAKFWLTYKNEVRSVLTTRKTEVSNQMKVVVVNCKLMCDLYIVPNIKLTHFIMYSKY